MASKASVKPVDFSNVKERGDFSPRRVPAGDYAAVITKVEDGESKKDGAFQYIFTFKLRKYSQFSYPYYCKLQENQLWKLRNLAVAAGLNVPRARTKFDPNRVVGKVVGVTMEDEEYEGREKSVVGAVFPVGELADGEMIGEEELDESIDNDGSSEVGDEDEAPPAPKKKGKKDKKKKKSSEEDYEEIEV